MASKGTTVGGGGGSAGIETSNTPSEVIYDKDLDELYSMKALSDDEYQEKLIELYGVDIKNLFEMSRGFYQSATEEGYEVIDVTRDNDYPDRKGVLLRKDNQIYLIEDSVIDYINNWQGDSLSQTNYSYNDVLQVFNNLPDSAKIYGGRVKLLATDQNFYDPVTGSIYLGLTGLDNAHKGTSLCFEETALHEHVHRLDFHGVKGFAEDVEGKTMISSHPYFRAISDEKRGAASGYSLQYRQEGNSAYYTENLSEATMPMGLYSNPLTRSNAFIEAPVPRRGVDMKYSTWVNSHEKLAEVAEKVYTAKNTSEITEFLDMKYEEYLNGSNSI